MRQLPAEFERPREALEEFQAVLLTEPGRFSALCGAAQAAEVADWCCGSRCNCWQEGMLLDPSRAEGPYHAKLRTALSDRDRPPLDRPAAASAC